jgi:hypothetical protein
MDASGTCPGRSQPHSRRNCLSAVSRSISIFVVAPDKLTSLVSG